jgi:acyl dehydratase
MSNTTSKTAPREAPFTREYYYDTWLEDGTQPLGYRETGWFAPRPRTPRRFTELRVGQEITPFQQGPVTRTQIVKYAAASWDFNPIHHDETFASKARSGGIIMHGMTVFAYLGRVATDFFGTPHLRQLSARFVEVTRPGDVLTLGGKVEELTADPGGNGGLVVISTYATNQRGASVAIGRASARLAG